MPGNENNELIAAGILRTLKYFGLFRYPLLPHEIHRFHPCHCKLEETLASLEVLANTGQIVCSREGFYTIVAHEEWCSERLAGHKRALALLSRSGRVTSIIRSFPFIDAIAISGSLSKYYAGKDADIDYFIITARNRLWLARSLLHLFKKLTFITGYQHYFCMNYFVDTDALEMSDKNIYTAIELSTLIPVYNQDRIIRLQSENSWLSEYLPNEIYCQDLTCLEPPGKERIKHLAERLINLLQPDRLNVFLMRLTDRKWRTKWSRKGFPMEDYDRAFHTSVHVSKNHPADFQKRILNALETNVPISGN